MNKVKVVLRAPINSGAVIYIAEIMMSNDVSYKLYGSGGGLVYPWKWSRRAAVLHDPLGDMP